MTCDSSRRAFLRQSALALAGAASATTVPREATAQPPRLLSAHRADIDGNGVVDSADEAIARNNLYLRRGRGLLPSSNFDTRADVLGRATVDDFTLAVVQRAVRELSGTPAAFARRPITVAWHYGWYNNHQRVPGMQTAKFLGGDYASSNPIVEAIFNDQKNEFGITVDALSWISEDYNLDLLHNYRRGYLRAENLSTRCVALLYESTIVLPTIGGRVDFENPAVPPLFVNHFERMADFLVNVRDNTPGRVFLLDDRPVIFIFASHTWGVIPLPDLEPPYRAIELAFDAARESFRRVYGRFPYVVGEEMFLSVNGLFAPDRKRRSTSFDAIYNYHHASNLKSLSISAEGTSVTSLDLTPSYLANQVGILNNSYQALRLIRNRYTGHQILIIPSLAAGFAKPGLPTLRVGRDRYATFMRTMERTHMEQYIDLNWTYAIGTAELPAPVYTVGSWNEEFEGHAVFPFSFNHSLERVVQSGFDLVMAIKQRFGWNHYATRNIV